jgi:hypothetical protein
MELSNENSRNGGTEGAPCAHEPPSKVHVLNKSTLEIHVLRATAVLSFVTKFVYLFCMFVCLLYIIFNMGCLHGVQTPC